MIGFHISIYRLPHAGSSPATAESEPEARIAVWQTGSDGLDWLETLVQSGAAISLGGFGYPTRYTAKAQDLLPRVIDRPPAARDPWRLDPGDTVTEQWAGATTIDHEVAAKCAPDEWLLVEAWDES